MGHLVDRLLDALQDMLEAGGVKGTVGKLADFARDRIIKTNEVVNLFLVGEDVVLEALGVTLQLVRVPDELGALMHQPNELISSLG